MQKKQQFRIIGTRGYHLIVSSQTFQQFIIHQYKYSQPSLHLKLAESKSPSLVPTVHYSIINENQTTIHDQTSSKIRIITKFYQSTLDDMMSKRGTFDQQQLINTLTEILQLLENLYNNNNIYGMLSASTICFCSGQICLNYGQINKRQEFQSYLQCDLRILGQLILKLSIKDNDSINNLLKLVQQKYSSKLIKLLKCLVDPVSKNRKNIFSSFNKDQTLVQNNSEKGIESFSQKIGKLNDLVNQYLKRSKKVIQRSENNRIK